MEDASDAHSFTTEMPVPIENGVTPSEIEAATENDTTKLNGDTNSEESDSEHSSDCATPANTDSENNLKRKLISNSSESGKSIKRLKSETEFLPPTNPYFNESLFELSGLQENTDKNQEDNAPKNGINGTQDIQDSEDAELLTKPKRVNPKRKKLLNQKVQECPQFLGLQPVIRFKCRKCGQSGFPSLILLKEHFKLCTGEPVISNKSEDSSKKLLVTRRNVYLCSACGCYYENYNLFLHVYKVHRRFVCLYCSAVFSHTEKFLFHLLTKHNCVPKTLDSEQDFFNTHKQPCYLMCCDCEKIFGDDNEEHFYGHACSGSKFSKNDSKSKVNNNSKVVVNNHKQLNNKNKVKSQGFVEHVTADTEDTPIMTNLDIKDSDSCENMKEDKKEETQTQSDSPPHSVSTETESNTTSAAIETDQKESELNLSNPDVPNSNTDLNSPINENEQIVSEDEVDDSVNSPEPVSDDQNTEETTYNAVQTEEVRKVPKVTLKIRKRTSSYEDRSETPEHEEDSDDSDKLTMEIDTNTMERNDSPNEENETKGTGNSDPVLSVAGTEIPVTELELEQPLDKFDIQVLLQKCLRLTIPTCIFCNHARTIAVNGKQLALHAIAEHRFSAVVNSITAEELIPESFVMRIKESLPELQDIFINLETETREEGAPFTHIFECFQCRYSTNVHKELYLHNRKMHAKSILLCIMCKSNFYNYSELTCHLCPGLYEQSNDVSFRCCICDADDLPSAFRLMVHLRKRHNACDVCLEMCHNQSRLSNHVWKHKLHHFCYRCGIAYRNKPDITKHLFWKHGTESVLCKRCLQKKWPHVYHFCTPPTTFTCDECNLNFTRAVALKVHKRLHSNEKPHACTFENCTETFISKKLLLKHEFKHREPTEIIDVTKQTRLELDENPLEILSNADEIKDSENGNEISKEEPKPKPIVDVLEDLPALNLSESDSSDSEDEIKDSRKATLTNTPTIDDMSENNSTENTELVNAAGTEPPVPVLENIWDNFKNYQAQKEKPSNSEVLENKVVDEVMETQDILVDEPIPSVSSESNCYQDQKQLVQAIMQDHDYSLLSQELKNDQHSEIDEQPKSMDHDYCTQNTTVEEEQAHTPEQPPSLQEDTKKEISTNSSSDSDSSNCSCGPDCSCSSGSSSSSSDSSDSDSSTSEGRRRQQARREQRKQRTKVKKESETSHIDVDVVAVATNVVPQPVDPPVELIIEETDLETTESETDEEFYDKQPQKLANKLLAEKRKELMMLADLGSLVNGTAIETSRPSTPSLPETEVTPQKPKKSKSKKKKRKSKKRERRLTDASSTFYDHPTVSPLSISLPKNSPMAISTPSLMTPPILSTLTSADFHSDLSNTSDSLRASKRRRIPNKFYGYSSDEEQEKHERLEKPTQPPVLKWRKADLPSPAPPPLLVPPITLKAIPSQPIEPETVPVQPSFHHPHPALFKSKTHDTTESNDSTSEEEQAMPTMNKPLNQPPLYCYCRCPYDEVSEMIGCDADDCLIEWFHFECVGIMVPPKGQWFCPDCRKKRQQRREMSQL